MQPSVVDPAQMVSIGPLELPSLLVNARSKSGEPNAITDRYAIPAWAYAWSSPEYVVFLQGRNRRPYDKVVEDR